MNTKNMLCSVMSYSAEMPDAAVVEKAFSGFEFDQDQWLGAAVHKGFERISGEMLQQFPSRDGFVFAVRIDTRKPPSSAVKRAVEDKVSRTEKAESRKVGKKERKQIKEEIEFNMRVKMPASSKTIYCFWHKTSKLFLSGASKSEADEVTSLMVHALEHIKASTIYISGITDGLSKRLLHWLEGDDMAFGDDLDAGESCTLKNHDGEKISVSSSDLRAYSDDLAKAIQVGGMTCESLQLTIKKMDGVCFTLDKNFRLSGISHTTKPEDMNDLEDPVYSFCIESESRTLLVCRIIDAVKAMFHYDKPED
ncbi:MAG: recombination-associated protein RdgC [Marinospirillum sp.]|uniref:recombination-associated protein RdgC n=1 Tax=Marinospirillum sp. TaxID=2183934 RepID=UPI001A06C021|nr:recombination-associated protein RdgC [Marinospirillum sp.]MBE0508423.1 recombination-associated protein RdgC [Marinospirillum sp.]